MASIGRFIGNCVVSNNIKSVRSLPTLCTRAYSTNPDEISKETHTGQSFETDDYRNVRFTNATRYVNKNWGINLIAEVPPKECTERVVCCDGGDPNLGHPKVYINLDKPGAHACGYCGLRFVLKAGHH
ncbi:probable NADH dehydrogenase [ubiquinone] iron-sulfur protein 6, mitochondrial [Contarinia nasturtii]|uniref:probable NADH dehydrogenase [ubiquinone] iron-sulfur protein 6, mitochondrial n=1 Tax=Contarinia nasturtii TaxID=265458 RepID=UPI0012D4BE85|nr:probable NADH dehydrogenase [ubiquinone] iron-sulfur protein 6, mitochondrial [Contarinia nasturtii]